MRQLDLNRRESSKSLIGTIAKMKSRQRTRRFQRIRLLTYSLFLVKAHVHSGWASVKYLFMINILVPTI